MIELLFYVLLIYVVAGWMSEIVAEYRATRPCEHAVRLSYHSLRLYQCVDCSALIPMVDNFKIKHQR